MGLGCYLLGNLITFVTTAPYDIVINLNALKNFHQEQALYAWSETSADPLFFSFISMPFVALLLWPLAPLSLLSGVLIFRVLNMALYPAGLILLSKRLPAANSIIPGLFWGAALTWPPVFDSLRLGQLNEILFGCLVLAWWGWVHQKRWVAGVGVGVAAAIKMIPILIIGYWVLRRRGGPALLALGIGMGLNLATCAGVLRSECRAFTGVIFPAISRGSAFHYNQSLTGFWLRIPIEEWQSLTAAPALPVWRGVAIACGVVVIGLVLAATRPWQASEAENESQRGLEFSIWLLVIALVSPITWWHYMVFLGVIPLASVLDGAVLRRLPGSTRALLVIGFVCMGVPPAWTLKIGHALQGTSTLLANGVVSIGLLGMLLWMAALLEAMRVVRAGPLVRPEASCR